MALPAFVEVPDTTSDIRIPPEEWQACIDSWILLAEVHLRCSDDVWGKSLEDDSSNVLGFLRSYFLALATAKSPLQLSKSAQLKRLCFLLSHRALSLPSPPSKLLSWPFLTSICMVFPRNEELRKLLSSAWKRRRPEVDAVLRTEKNSQIKMLDSGKFSAATPYFKDAIPLLHQTPDVAAFLMTGSDLLDAIDIAYRKAGAMDVESGSELRKILTMYTYLGLIGLLTCSEPNASALSDQVYTLKSSSNPDQPSLLTDLATNTPLLPKLRELLAAQDDRRLSKLENVIYPYRHSDSTRPKRLVKRKVDKGKGIVHDDFGHQAVGGIHVHRMSKITQVQDLFPDLGSGFIMKLLDEYGEDVEQVTAHLLDESLPAHLSGLDRSQQLPVNVVDGQHDLAPHMAPRSTPPLERRNIYDNDELDNLAADASRLHFGRANLNQTADGLLADRTTAPNKAAIISALAAFDSDDDERDDTYDVEDVGGTVDTIIDSDEANVDKNEETLYQAYRMNADTFARDAGTRRGKARLALKTETGMTDEAIEGWAVMLARDLRKLKRLEAKYATFTGQQTAIERTAWRESTEGEDGESSGGEAFKGGRGRGKGRGRGGRGGRGGAPVSGPSNEAGTQQARHRKDVNKSSQANHNRRDQRARKMARGGFPG